MIKLKFITSLFQGRGTFTSIYSTSEIEAKMAQFYSAVATPSFNKTLVTARYIDDTGSGKLTTPYEMDTMNLCRFHSL